MPQPTAAAAAPPHTPTPPARPVPVKATSTLEEAGAVMPQSQGRAVGAAPVEQAPVVGTQRPPLATHSLPAGQHTPVGSPINAVRGKKLSAAATSANASESKAVSVEDWDEDDVERFLRGVCKLPQYAPAFQDAGIDGSMLVELTNEELEELGVANKFHRRKIMKKIGVAKAVK